MKFQKQEVLQRRCLVVELPRQRSIPRWFNLAPACTLQKLLNAHPWVAGLAGNRSSQPRSQSCDTRRQAARFYDPCVFHPFDHRSSEPARLESFKGRAMDHFAGNVPHVLPENGPRYTVYNTNAANCNFWWNKQTLQTRSTGSSKVRKTVFNHFMLSRARSQIISSRQRGIHDAVQKLFR